MKIHSYIAFFILTILALIPPIDIHLSNPSYPYWLMLVLTAAFFGVFTLFIKTNNVVRIVAIGGLINCFLGLSPLIGFTSYLSLVFCCYFYILCTRIEDWSLIFKGIQSLVIVNAILLIMEFFHRDTLLDFGQTYINNFGVIGQHMQMGSFAVVISALLLSFSKINILFALAVAIFAKTSWTFLCAGVGIIVYVHHLSKKASAWAMIIFMLIFSLWISTGKFQENTSPEHSSRKSVWVKSIQLTNDNHKNLTGWGIGSFKDVFHSIAFVGDAHPVIYREAHNFIIQLIWEIGYPLTGCLLFGLGWLFLALWRSKLYLLASGLSMIFMDGLVHFPDRMVQTVPLIIVFLAYCTVSLRKARGLPRDQRRKYRRALRIILILSKSFAKVCLCLL